MAFLEPIEAPPIIGTEDGLIVCAATVTARITQNRKHMLEVVTWQAGRGQEVLWLTPSEFSTWRRSFARPDAVD